MPEKLDQMKLFTYYEVTVNSDLTEGRGIQRPVGYFTTEDAAYQRLKSTGGIMGTDSGKEMNKVSFEEVQDYFLVKTTERIWGYRTEDRKIGWIDGRDLPKNDPEYDTYLRLKEKFENG